MSQRSQSMGVSTPRSSNTRGWVPVTRDAVHRVCPPPHQLTLLLSTAASPAQAGDTGHLSFSQPGWCSHGEQEYWVI